MTEEEYVKNRLDMINRNSIYGLCAANSSEIAKIVRSYIERDTGNGYDRFNSPPPPIPIRPVKVKTLKERLEGAMMKATSVQNIKDVKDISFTIVNDPIEMESKLTIVATTDDDIFAFEFEGPDILCSCKKSGLFTGWEKDQKIRELEKEKQQLKEEYEDKIDDLQHEYNLEKAANEAHHRFFKQYAGRGTEIEFNHDVGDDETTYVIVDKDRYQSLKNIQNNVRLHGMDFTPDELVNRIKELEKHSDNVNHPSHYETGKYECIEVMQEVFGTAAVCDFCKCNAFKYIYRMDRKNGTEDAKKAIWYLNKYLELTEKEE